MKNKTKSKGPIPEKLKKFTRSRETEETTVTTVNIFLRQHQYVEQHGLNLSQLVRELLDQFIGRK